MNESAMTLEEERLLDEYDAMLADQVYLDYLKNKKTYSLKEIEEDLKLCL